MRFALRHLVRSIFSKNDINPNKAPTRSSYEGCASYEALERRVFLSGSVAASVVRGSLNVRGDAEANALTFDQTGLNADQVRISATSDTALNGGSDPVILSGVTRGARIRMGNGADSVIMRNLSLPGDVSITDVATLALNNVQVAKNLNLQNGSSTTTVANTTVGKNLVILPGPGGQNVALQSVQVQRNTQIGSGNGADLLTIDDSMFHGKVRLRSGNGGDVIQIEANGGPLGSPTLFDGQVSMSLAAGDDTLQLGVTGQTGNRSVFGGAVDFSGGDGHDTFLTFDASSYTSTARFSARNFESNTPIPDTAAAPVVSSSDPANNATDVARNRKIAATFSEPMDPLTITTANVTATGPGAAAVDGTVTYFGNTMTFTPTNPLAANTAFTLNIGTSAKDRAGNSLASAFVSNFTTGATSDTTAPTVTSSDPANNSTGFALNKKIAATFSEAMDPLTITSASVTVTGLGGVPVSGSVAYAGTTATFIPADPLSPNSTFILTISTVAKDLAGNSLATPFVSSFTTGATSDTTAPTVTSSDPADSATDVALNKKIAVTFSEAMDPLTITPANVKVIGAGGAPVVGTVGYVGNTMTFTPTDSLAPNTTFTLTISKATRDLAGNPLAGDFVTMFTTGATPDTVAPTVTSTNPANAQTNVAINKTVAATFSESMDPLTIAANFAVTGPGSTPVTGTVNYDAPSKIATFTPSANLAASTTFTATISGGANGAKDLAGNSLASDKVWTFTTGTQVAQAPINLGAAGAFAVMATASITSSGSTLINGDVGLNPGSAQGIPPAQVNGSIHVGDQAIINAQSALLAAYNDAVSRSVTSQSLPGNLGGLTFTPGLYTNSTSVLIQGAGPANNVTLDAQGDPNAIFIFKMGSTLTTGPGAQVILAGGAKASNVFWQVGTSATLDTTTIFKGNILASVTITVNTGSVIEGRLLGGSNSDGSVTINASTVTLPTA